MLNRLFDALSSFFFNPKKVMWLTFILGIILSVISILCITGYANDAGLYIAMAHAFSIGDWSRAFLDNIPPLVPVMSGLITMLGIPPWDSAMIVNCTFCVLAIFPIFAILTFFMDKKYAAWGALFYLIAPKIMRWGLTPLTEGSRFFFFILPVYFTFSFIRNKKLYVLVLLGISLALLALVRGEGILSAPIMLFALVLLCWRDNKYKLELVLLKKIIAYCFIVVCVMFVFLSPRLYQVYEKTGFPATDVRVVNLFKAYYDRFLDKKEISKMMPNGLTTYTYSNSKEAVPVTLENRDRLSWKYINDFIQNIVRGSYEIYFVFSIFGIVLLLKKREWVMEHNLLLFFAFMNAFMFYFSSTPYRYFLVNVMLLMPFTIIGYKQILEWADKWRVYNAHKVLMLIVLFVAIGQIVNGMDNSIDKRKIYWQKIGSYLKKNVNLIKPEAQPATVYIIGNDTGTNLFNTFNVINPGRTGIILSVQEALKGFDSGLCLSVPQLTSGNKTLVPDFFIVDIDFKNDIALLKNNPDIKEIPTKWIRDAILFENLRNNIGDSANVK